MVEFQVVVIGAGPGGYLTAIKLAQLGGRAPIHDFARRAPIHDFD